MIPPTREQQSIAIRKKLKQEILQIDKSKPTTRKRKHKLSVDVLKKPSGKLKFLQNPNKHKVKGEKGL